MASSPVQARRTLLLIAAIFPVVAASGCEIPMTPVARVSATLETDPVRGVDDAADDAAIWVHPDDPSRSVVIGTDKADGGLAIYDLTGRQIQYLETGKLNNIDLRNGFALEGEGTALLIATNRSEDTMEAFRVEPATRRLSPIPASNNRAGFPVLGTCMYRSPSSGKFYVFITERKGGRVEQWEVKEGGAGVTFSRLRALDVGGESEGCVADDEKALLYIAEQDRGIWRYGAEPDSGNDRVRLGSVGWFGHLSPDIEGLAIYKAGEFGGYLIASSQGDDTFHLYDRASGVHLGAFQITEGVVDSVSETDGIDVASVPLGPAFPNGLFVAQDGQNEGPDGRKERQNFKFVRWEAIARHFGRR
jgi:3-phytase